MLRFHAKALQLIGESPKVGPGSSAALAAAEKRIGRPLPASLKEWYSLDGACDILYRYSNGDPPVSLTDLGRDGLVGSDLLIFRYENQGVCAWAVRLDGSDDPPVFVDVDHDAEFQIYTQCTSAFSEFVYACLWDWGQVLYNCLIRAQNAPVSDEAVAFLRRNFKPEPETHGWPGDTQYRFYSPDQRILIWADKDRADWTLAGDSEEAVSRLARTLWDVDDLGRSFWSHNQTGEFILRELRASKSQGS